MVKQLSVFFGLVFLASCTQILPPFEEPLPENDFKVHPIYVIPFGELYVDDHAARIGRGVYATQNWFQTATGGLTFELLDEENTFEVYLADHPKEYYEEDWWNKLLEELAEKRYPVQSKGTILMLWVEGISDVGDDQLAIGGWSCEGDCGAAILPISTLVAPTRLPVDMGSIYHELGHTFGLSHPIEQSDLPLDPEEEPILYSVMCQSDLRAGVTSTDHGFLTSEKAALTGNSFMKANVRTYQDIWTSRIINYPALGDEPEPEISFEVLPNAVARFSTNIDDGLLYYWYFGDGNTSTEANPTHAFSGFGLFNVTLMVTTKDYMSARTSTYINLN